MIKSIVSNKLLKKNIMKNSQSLYTHISISRPSFLHDFGTDSELTGSSFSVCHVGRGMDPAAYNYCLLFTTFLPLEGGRHFVYKF